ncbi:MAG: metallophosphatase [Flavobacteriaceae bacterium]|nr:metallophosphatase [Flavobacteriaceae bacterium]
MKRRDFITKTTAATALLTMSDLALLASEKNQKRHITILHTNDVHSHIDAFNANHPRYPNLGGAAKRAAYINSVRNENPNLLLLDAGDMFQGTPYFNYFGGELEFKLMNMMQYDAATIGNHEFDNGIDGLLKQIPNAQFDLLSANYDFSNTVLNSFVKPYKVFKMDGVKIGVFGLGVKLEGLVDKKMYKETVYLNPLEIAQDMTRILKNEEKCDLIICLSHLGYYYKATPETISDLNLAAKTKDIDLIIGGHTHTFLPKPTLVKNLDDKNMLVNQVGWSGINMGRIDFYLEPQKATTHQAERIIIV